MKPTEVINTYDIHPRFKLSALWVSVTLCYLYGDYLGLFRPGALQSMLEGQMGPLGPTTQGVLLGVAVMMVIPCLMVALSLLLPTLIARWSNIVFGLFFTVIMAVSMPGAWNFYLFLGGVEMLLTVAVMWVSWCWGKSDGKDTAKGNFILADDR